MEKTHTGQKTKTSRVLPSADIEQVVYWPHH